MFYAYVQRFNVIDTVQKNLGTKHPLIINAWITESLPGPAAVTPRILREFARILRTSPALFTPALFSLPHFLPPPARTESS